MKKSSFLFPVSKAQFLAKSTSEMAPDSLLPTKIPAAKHAYKD